MTDSAPPPLADTSTAPIAFPGEDDLCEQCGYPIKGLDAAGACPECGSLIDASHPRFRIGPAFRHRPKFTGFLATVVTVALHPKQAFRVMSLSGTNIAARVFLLANALITSLLGLVAAAGVTNAVDRRSWLGGEFSIVVMWAPLLGLAMMVMAAGLIAVGLLTYIEVLGVTWFSRKRGWRVPLRHAERVACYASVGWLPGAVLFGLVMNLSRGGMIEDLWATLGGNPVYGPDAAWATVFLAAVVAMLGFETLVWVGVRQVKFANTRPGPPTRRSTSENAPSARRA